ncbi:hypothetical protein H6F88_00895 [Oculatella sp. FACHB-28]|uniref:sigma factor-like helix-turn-helix DNA-binding protein n=1 Tax=Oculatella sp. FACHB-28 TaxID=2692845 RepID=UPI001686D7FF|nr:sigma factor-like helix-turn-helix DNA-binding protein [Oculatella sp. FACHB-28]MBD2054600.1 hypothetical protein [Oculatella sp. FACHB-28]
MVTGDCHIIEQRWGIGTTHGCKQPLSKVSETVNPSRERIRQRETKAFAQLRRRTLEDYGAEVILANSAREALRGLR